MGDLDIDAIRERYAHYGAKLPNHTAACDVRALADEVERLRQHILDLVSAAGTDVRALVDEMERLRAELARRPRVWREGDAEPDNPDDVTVIDRRGGIWCRATTGWGRAGLHGADEIPWIVLVSYGPLVEVGGAS